MRSTCLAIAACLLPATPMPLAAATNYAFLPSVQWRDSTGAWREGQIEIDGSDLRLWWRGQSVAALDLREAAATFSRRVKRRRALARNLLIGGAAITAGAALNASRADPLPASGTTAPVPAQRDWQRPAAVGASATAAAAAAAWMWKRPRYEAAIQDRTKLLELRCSETDFSRLRAALHAARSEKSAPLEFAPQPDPG